MGAAQRQVASVSQVTAGTFYVDYAAQRIYLGLTRRVGNAGP